MITLKEITTQRPDILPLIIQLNPKADVVILKRCLNEIFTYSNYYSFGLELNGKLIGFSGVWLTVKFYSGKQLEIDNFIIDTNYRSQNYGTMLLKYIEEFANKISCKTIELNAYVESYKPHSFYFKNKFKILGFHFQKLLK